jgi:hypothetical protein
MMPDLMQALANERTRDRERSISPHFTAFSDQPSRRPRRVAIRCGYWLITIGCRLVAPDLSTVAH